MTGYHISFKQNSETLALSLHDSFSKFTPMDFIKRDRGKDMIGTQVEAIFQQVSTVPVDVEPRHGQGKGVERFGGIVARDFCPQFSGWCGNSSANKPDTIKPTMTLEELRAAFAEWLREYHATPSSALGGKSPNEVLKAH